MSTYRYYINGFRIRFHVQINLNLLVQCLMNKYIMCYEQKSKSGKSSIVIHNYLGKPVEI